MKKETGISDGEIIFLRYAFSAIKCCGDKATEEETFFFEEILKSGINPSNFPLRKRFEELFPNGSQYIKNWNSADARHYWLEEHNKFVAKNSFCKVYFFEVKEITPPKNREVCRVLLDYKKNLEAKSYIPLKKNDLVSMHILQVAEKLKHNEIETYLENESSCFWKSFC